MPPESIDEVLSALDAIVRDALTEGSRLGYFAALYRRVTRAVKDGIAAGRFEDGPRMSNFDVVFARRYLDAYCRFRGGASRTRSWLVAFEAAADPFPLVVQQLLAGMNAHINLDLGISAAVVAPGVQIGGLQADFDEINLVLAEQVNRVEQELAAISPVAAMLQRCGLRSETCVINFSLSKARGCAWAAAQRFAGTPPAQWDAQIASLDVEVAALGRLVLRPPPPLDVELLPIRASECQDIRRNLAILAA